MSDQMQSDVRLAVTMSSDGWPDVRAVADAMVKEDEEYLLHAMSRKPDTLTGKTAIKHAARRAAILDFLETLDDRMRLMKSRQRE